ncbi:hypothetical protein CROQUDRAFT_100692, partial [Cronartium quercuum f. sp. fusiforme G11]
MTGDMVRHGMDKVPRVPSADPIYDPTVQRVWIELEKIRGPKYFTRSDVGIEDLKRLESQIYDGKPSLQISWQSVQQTGLASLSKEKITFKDETNLFWRRLQVLTLIVASNVSQSLWNPLLELQLATWRAHRPRPVKALKKFLLMQQTAVQVYSPTLFFQHYVTAQNIQESVAIRYRAFISWFQTEFAAHEAA